MEAKLLAEIQGIDQSRVRHCCAVDFVKDLIGFRGALTALGSKCVCRAKGKCLFQYYIQNYVPMIC